MDARALTWMVAWMVPSMIRAAAGRSSNTILSQHRPQQLAVLYRIPTRFCQAIRRHHPIPHPFKLCGVSKPVIKEVPLIDVLADDGLDDGIQPLDIACKRRCRIIR